MGRKGQSPSHAPLGHASLGHTSGSGHSHGSPGHSGLGHGVLGHKEQAMADRGQLEELGRYTDQLHSKQDGSHRKENM